MEPKWARDRVVPPSVEFARVCRDRSVHEIHLLQAAHEFRKSRSIVATPRQVGDRAPDVCPRAERPVARQGGARVVIGHGERVANDRHFAIKLPIV
jgi:hypothetical protein